MGGQVLLIASSNTPPLVTGSYNLTRRRPSSAVSPGRSARGSTIHQHRAVCLEADATATVQAPARRTEIKTVIPKLSDNFFHQELPDLTH